MVWIFLSIFLFSRGGEVLISFFGLSLPQIPLCIRLHPPFYSRRPCTWNSDTQCQACPSGFWSATTEDSVKCVPCQTCTSDEVVVKECSVSSDTVCCPKTNQNCTLSDASINGKHVSWSCTSSLLSSVACDHLSVTDRSKDPSVSRGRLEDELLLLTSNKNWFGVLVVRMYTMIF